MVNFVSTTTDARYLGPGTWVVRCFPDSVDSASTPLSEYSAPILVVDPDGLWPDLSAEQAPASVHAPFVPVPAVDGGTARLEMTWPDGSTATLTYPAELDLLSTGVQPDLSYAWADDPPADHPIVFLHGAPGVEAKYVEGEPRATFPVLGGGVATFWAAAESSSLGIEASVGGSSTEPTSGPSSLRSTTRPTQIALLPPCPSPNPVAGSPSSSRWTRSCSPRDSGRVKVR